MFQLKFKLFIQIGKTFYHYFSRGWSVLNLSIFKIELEILKVSDLTVDTDLFVILLRFSRKWRTYILFIQLKIEVEFYLGHFSFLIRYLDFRFCLCTRWLSFFIWAADTCWSLAWSWGVFRQVINVCVFERNPDFHLAFHLAFWLFLIYILRILNTILFLRLFCVGIS